MLGRLGIINSDLFSIKIDVLAFYWKATTIIPDLTFGRWFLVDIITWINKTENF